MRALCIIVQTKKGENIFILTSNTFSCEIGNIYSRHIYDLIIHKFKKSQKIERAFLISKDLTCVCNISKDLIVQVIVPNNEVFFGIECLKKANDIIIKYYKNEQMYRKFLELYHGIEDLLYTKEISPIRLNMPLKTTEIISSKKSTDNEIFYKFPLLNIDTEKNIIPNLLLKYSKRNFSHKRDKLFTLNIMKYKKYTSKQYIELINQSDPLIKLKNITAKLALNRPQDDDNTRKSLKKHRMSILNKDYSFNLTDFNNDDLLPIHSKSKSTMQSNEPMFPSNLEEIKAVHYDLPPVRNSKQYGRYLSSTDQVMSNLDGDSPNHNSNINTQNFEAIAQSKIQIEDDTHNNDKRSQVRFSQQTNDSPSVRNMSADSALDHTNKEINIISARKNSVDKHNRPSGKESQSNVFDGSSLETSANKQVVTGIGHKSQNQITNNNSSKDQQKRSNPNMKPPQSSANTDQNKSFQNIFDLPPKAPTNPKKLDSQFEQFKPNNNQKLHLPGESSQKNEVNDLFGNINFGYHPTPKSDIIFEMFNTSSNNRPISETSRSADDQFNSNFGTQTQDNSGSFADFAMFNTATGLNPCNMNLEQPFNQSGNNIFNSTISNTTFSEENSKNNVNNNVAWGSFSGFCESNPSNLNPQNQVLFPGFESTHPISQNHENNDVMTEEIIQINNSVIILERPSESQNKQSEGNTNSDIIVLTTNENLVDHDTQSNPLPVPICNSESRLDDLNPKASLAEENPKSNIIEQSSFKIEDNEIKHVNNEKMRSEILDITQFNNNSNSINSELNPISRVDNSTINSTINTNLSNNIPQLIDNDLNPLDNITNSGMKTCIVTQQNQPQNSEMDHSNAVISADDIKNNSNTSDDTQNQAKKDIIPNKISDISEKPNDKTTINNWESQIIVPKENTKPERKYNNNLNQINLRLMEKLYVTVKNGKIENLKMFGQLLIDSDVKVEADKHLRILVDCDIWEDEKMIHKRPSSSKISLKALGSNLYNLEYQQLNEPTAGIVDYIIGPRCFNISKIPIFLIYKIETSDKNASNILIQYKVNEKWIENLLDIEICVQMKTILPAYEIDVIPKASEIIDHKIIWKAKLLPANSKGKLCINIKNITENPNQIIDHFKITFKSPRTIYESLNVYATCDTNNDMSNISKETNENYKSADKRLFVEYKILPNS